MGVPEAEAARAQLDDRLIAAHEAGDLTGLVSLYREAANLMDASGDEAAAAFYLTHAYVFALEAGDPAAAELRCRLLAIGREE